MKAAAYDRPGPPDVIEICDVAKPVPKDDEVLVRVRATTICAADYRLRKAGPLVARAIIRPRRPGRKIVLGMEFAGTVEAVGKAVSRFHPGDDVFGSTRTRFGAHAEYVCVPQGEPLAAKPEELTHEQAAALLFGGISALHFIRKAGVGPGQRVLVYGASGSVGAAAVQLARHFGARVTGVCSADNIPLVRSLGADEVVDYTRADFSRAGPVYDVVLDAVGKAGLRRSLRSLKPGGVFVAIAGARSWLLGGLWTFVTRRARVIGGMAKSRPGDVAFLLGLVRDGEFRVVIDRTYPLEQIGEAFRYAEAGHKKGAIVLLV